MTDKKKVTFIKSEMHDTVRSVTFASYLKKDYINQSFLVMLNIENDIIEIFFKSNTYGTVHWENGVGLLECRKCEAGNDAQASSFLTRRYTTVQPDNRENITYAKEKIIKDILDNMEDRRLAKRLWDVINTTIYEKEIEFPD